MITESFDGLPTPAPIRALERGSQILLDDPSGNPIALFQPRRE